MDLNSEYRAVFSYPPISNYPDIDTYGPSRSTIEETNQDRPINIEETHGWRNGTQRRYVTQWENINGS